MRWIHRRKGAATFAMCGLAVCHLVACGDTQERSSDAGRVLEDDAWSIIVLPDTQILAQDYPEIFEVQTRWIVTNRDALNLQFVLHVGDIVDDNIPSQWEVAESSMRLLDGRVPYVLVPGNHDYGPNGSALNRDTWMNMYFPIATTYEEWPSFGGTFAEDSIENSFHVFETPSGPWLVVALEFGPRQDVARWANDVIALHSPMPAIIVTHAYLYSDDTRYDWNTRPDQMWNPHSYGLASLPGGVQDGEEMFQSFIRQNSNVDIVISGHVLNDGVGRLTSEQDDGDEVHQLLANFQHESEGGAGFLRIMTFRNGGTEVDVQTYSPYLDEYKNDPENEFSFVL